MRLTLLLVALLLPSAVAQTTPDALAGALQAAARAGNAAAYRELLHADGTFAVEGTNFAADLGRVPQPTVTYQFSDVEATGTEAHAQLNLSWERQPGQVSQSELPVTLQKVGGVWRYAGEALTLLPTDGFSLYVLSQPDLRLRTRAANVGALLPEAAAHVQDVLGLNVPATATVKVYPNPATLSASVALSLKPVGGWNEPGEAIKLVLPQDDDPRLNLLRVLSHEFTHLSVSAAAGPGRDKRIPWWLHEGLADFVARAYWPPDSLASEQRRVAGYAQKDWVSLAELADFNTVPENQWSHVYGQGLGLVEFLAATKGEEAPMQLALAFAQTGNADDAARALDFAFFAALETAARAWLAARQG